MHEKLRNIPNGANIEFVELAVKVIAHKAATEMHVHHILCFGPVPVRLEIPFSLLVQLPVHHIQFITGWQSPTIPQGCTSQACIFP